jgi:hypothetical protein
MLKKKMEFIFLATILVAGFFLAWNYYKTYSFKNNPLPPSYLKKIDLKEKEILANMQKYYGFIYRFPLIITDKIPGRLYGLTSYRNGSIKIFLNKKVMQESFDYMLSDVIAHEYAHALVFKISKNHNEGHSKLWQQTCQKLGGKNCQQYVDQKEIIMSKISF